MLVAQRIDCRAGHAQQRKHAALRLDEIERAIAGQRRADAPPAARASPGSDLACSSSFDDPGLPQLRVGEDAGGNRCAVVRRHRIDAARDLQHMALHGLGPGFIFADRRSGHRRARGTNPYFWSSTRRSAPRADFSVTRRTPATSAVKIGAEALVGQIEERGEVPALQQLRQGLPLFDGPRSAPARVVAAGVHQDHIALGRSVQTLQHRVETQLMLLCIVIGIALELSVPSFRAGGCGCPRSDRSRAPSPKAPLRG